MRPHPFDSAPHTTAKTPRKNNSEHGDEVVKEDFAETRAGGVTAQHLWSLGGSATGEQAVEIARQTAEEKAAKAAQRVASRSREVYEAVVSKPA